MKVLIPDLPTTDELIPFLRRIDANRIYSNGGPLVTELESRLDGVCVSSATLGLELAVSCLFRPGMRVRIPAFSFVATATAVLRTGRSPVLCDVDSETWAGIECDLPVCPFGAAVPGGGALIDAAAAYGNQKEGNRVFSLHATKNLAAGEGGVVCGEERLKEKVRELTNFGMREGQVRRLDGTNAKLSEYGAAVALASLERLPRVLAKRQLLEARYRSNLAGFELQKRPAGSYSQFPVLVDERERVVQELQAFGIETRSWYCPTLNFHPAYTNLHTDGPLKTAKMLSERLLCLPFHSFMSLEDVDEVSDRLKRVTGR